MDVSIIFVNYKTKDLTINAIKSVIEKTKGLDYEIFVVDNNSSDGSIEAIQKEFFGIELSTHPLSQGDGAPVYIIRNPINAGFGAANNLAIKQARGKYILCLNTDTLLINNAIKILFDFMEREGNRNVAVCGGYLTDKDNNPTICGGNFPSLTDVIWKFGIRKLFPQNYKNYCVTLDSNDEKYLKNIDYITGAGIFFRKSVLDEVGVFDERFFMYYEETDLCKRIKDAGYEIKFVADAEIQHIENQSINSELRHMKMVKTSEIIYFKKHHPSLVFLIKIIYSILYLIDWLILGHKDSKELINTITRENGSK